MGKKDNFDSASEPLRTRRSVKSHLSEQQALEGPVDQWCVVAPLVGGGCASHGQRLRCL